jgi:hypothetical protein
MNKSVSIGVVLVTVLVVASVAAIYFSEPSINYRVYLYDYLKTGDQVYTNGDNRNDTSYPGAFTTISCQNNGFFEGTFSVIVKLTNASFQEQNFQPSQLINSTTAKLAYTLNGQQKNSTAVYFNIDSNVTGFVISIAFQTNQLFIRSTETNAHGQSDFVYSMNENYWLPSLVA